MESPLLEHNENSDIGEEKTVKSAVKNFGFESKKLWRLAGPAILTSVFQYSLGALTQTFAGQVGDLDLAAVSVENSVVAGLAFGVMVHFKLSSSSFFNFLHLCFSFCHEEICLVFWDTFCMLSSIFFYS